MFVYEKKFLLVKTLWTLSDWISDQDLPDPRFEKSIFPTAWYEKTSFRGIWDGSARFGECSFALWGRWLMAERGKPFKVYFGVIFVLLKTLLYIEERKSWRSYGVYCVWWSSRYWSLGWFLSLQGPIGVSWTSWDDTVFFLGHYDMSEVSARSFPVFWAPAISRDRP